MMRCLIFIFALFFAYSCKNKVNETEGSDTTLNSKTDTSNVGQYNELANESDHEVFTSSSFNMDVESIENIKRPGSSSIRDFTFKESELFGIWSLDPHGPHADFTIDSAKFYVVDYDGDGSMPYEIHADKIKVYYNDFILNGEIKNVTGDSLQIKWYGTKSVSKYVRVKPYQQ